MWGLSNGLLSLSRPCSTGHTRPTFRACRLPRFPSPHPPALGGWGEGITRGFKHRWAGWGLSSSLLSPSRLCRKPTTRPSFSPVGWGGAFCPEPNHHRTQPEQVGRCGNTLRGITAFAGGLGCVCFDYGVKRVGERVGGFEYALGGGLNCGGVTSCPACHVADGVGAGI